MPQVIKDITLVQIVGWILMASVSINTWFVKEEITGLRDDIKELRKAQSQVEANYAGLKAEFQSYVRYTHNGR